jgi:hypothetical protein
MIWIIRSVSWYVSNRGVTISLHPYILIAGLFDSEQGLGTEVLIAPVSHNSLDDNWYKAKILKVWGMESADQ